MKEILISRSGINVLNATDPNDFIFHSGLNSLKILDTGLSDIAVSGGSGISTKTIAHNVAGAAAYVLFIQFPDGKVAMISDEVSNEFDTIENFVSPYTVNYPYIYNSYIDDNNIGFDVYKPTSATLNLKARYYIFETPLGGATLENPINSTRKIAIAKDGYNAITDNNPDHLRFSSDFNTLKYFKKDFLSFSVTVPSVSYPNISSASNVAVYHHNLGYYPLVLSYAYESSRGWICPYTRGGLVTGYHIDMYIDDNTLYAKIWGHHAGTVGNEDMGAVVYFSIFRNNLGFPII